MAIASCQCKPRRASALRGPARSAQEAFEERKAGARWQARLSERKKAREGDQVLPKAPCKDEVGHAGIAFRKCPRARKLPTVGSQTHEEKFVHRLMRSEVK